MEYLRSNFRPLQSLDHRHIFKSAVKDAWLPDLTGGGGSDPYGTEASKGQGSLSKVKYWVTLKGVVPYLFQFQPAPRRVVVDMLMFWLIQM